MWPLVGVAVVVVGFLVRLNPLLVIAAAVAATGWGAGISPDQLLRVFGKAFNDSRYVSGIWIVLPVIGLLERSGLQERARLLISKVHAATTGRLLLLYLAVRQISAAVGLLSLGGHAQMVRPLVAPMAEAAAESRYGDLPKKIRYRIRAYAAAADNVGVFFGEDVFLAVGSILLIKGFLEADHIIVDPFALSLWAIPTAILAFLVHGTRLLLLDRKLARELKKKPDSTEKAAAE
ncbi:MAG: DUF969 domain-containing protein [Proteobacteria bacterium]|nr:DUF969 domain-containing protein [Pseudomonadota bacterium]